MKPHHRLIILSLLLLIADPLSAQQQQAPAHYVLLVDTSFSMARHKPALLQTVRALVQSGFNSQLREGDRFTIWTFNERVFDNRFSPQTWSPDQAQALAERAAQFIKSQRFEKQTRVDRAIGALRDAIQAPNHVTVILCSDGDTMLAGTPFDRAVNEIYVRHRQEVRRMRRVLLTTFTGQQGRLLTWAVGMSRDIDGAVAGIGAIPPPVPSAVPTLPSKPEAPVETNSAPLIANKPSVAAASPPESFNEITIKTARSGAKPLPEAPTGSPAPISVIVATPAVVPEMLDPPPAPEKIKDSEAIQPLSTSAENSVTFEAPNQPAPVMTQGTKPAAVSVAAHAENQPAAPAPVLATSDSVLRPKKFLVAGLLLLFGAVVTAVWIIRPNRPRQPSLISRSLDQPKKR